MSCDSEQPAATNTLLKLALIWSMPANGLPQTMFLQACIG